MRLFILVICSVLPFAASLVYFLPEHPVQGFGYFLLFSKAFSLTAPFLFWKYLGLPLSWKTFGKYLGSSDPFKIILKKILRGIVLGLAMGAFVYMGYEFLSDNLKAILLERIRLKIDVLGIREHFFIYILSLSFIHSLLEEFYWRFFILKAWKKFLPLPHAHFVAALAFALHHFVATIYYLNFGVGMLMGFGVIGAGLIWSLIFEFENSLTTVWVSHVVVDIVLMTFGLHALNVF